MDQGHPEWAGAEPASSLFSDIDNVLFFLTLCFTFKTQGGLGGVLHLEVVRVASGFWTGGFWSTDLNFLESLQVMGLCASSEIWLWLWLCCDYPLRPHTQTSLLLVVWVGLRAD